MDGVDEHYSNFVAIGIAMLFALLLTAPLSSASENSTHSGETIVDGRITGFQSNPSEPYVRQWTMVEDQWFSITLDCNQCEAQVKLDGITTSTTSVLSLQAMSNTTLELTITSSEEEFVSYSLVQNIDENYPTIRPAPSETIELHDVKKCNIILECLNPERGNLYSIGNGEYNESQFLRGILEQGNAEYVPINVSAGDSLELQLMHATADVSFSIFFQNQTSEILTNQTIEQSNTLSANTISNSKYWYFHEDGRVLMKVESDSLNTAWVLKASLFNDEGTNTFIQVHEDLKIVGHFSTSATIEMNDTQKFTLQSALTNSTVRIDQLVSGSWISGEFLSLISGQEKVFYPYPNISAARFIVESEVHWIDILVGEFDDIDSGEEAPSYLPSSVSTENSSWPLMPLQSGQLEGQLTLSIHDTADVYRIEIEGWDESEHLVKIVVEGAHVEVLQLELWSIEQETWIDEDSRTVTLANGKIQTALEMSRGTHFFRISHLDSINHTEHNWGDDVPSVTYFVSSIYTLIDEGNEPYFPPDDNAVKWGTIARFFLGSLFLIPVILFGVQLYRSKKTAENLLLKTEQLAWFKQQMDSGESTPQQSRKSLTRALHAVTMLEWEEANKAWGPSDLEYRTENVALAVWKLDERMAKQQHATPLMVGIHILEGNWDLAALRFDAPVGEAWNIELVEPRFLHRGEEVFLDTMAKGNKTFIMAEITGNASAVDIELNGRMDGEASAARIPSTLTVKEP
tara:strand:- start:176 stop:2404 length:2229 start_codon:yes stop_codon:yes gene_type:complete